MRPNKALNPFPATEIRRALRPCAAPTLVDGTRYTSLRAVLSPRPVRDPRVRGGAAAAAARRGRGLGDGLRPSEAPGPKREPARASPRNARKYRARKNIHKEAI